MGMESIAKLSFDQKLLSILEHRDLKFMENHDTCSILSFFHDPLKQNK